MTNSFRAFGWVRRDAGWLWAGLVGILVISILGQFSLFPAGQVSAASQPESTTLLDGRLAILWGDGAPDSGLQQERLVLSRSGQPDVELAIGATLPMPYDELMKLQGSLVTVAGAWDILDPQVLRVNAIEPENERAALQPQVSGSKPWVTLLCKFKDFASEPYPPAYFQGMYSSAYPGLDHYWREQSYNQMNVAGSQTVAKWYTLPQPRSYYITSSGLANTSLLASDCTAAADSAVNFTAYTGINMMFNAELDGYAWGGMQYISLDGVYRVWYMTWEPPWGYADLAVIAHEMGHGFGLPHSAFDRSRVYDNPWDVMSDTWTNCFLATDPTYGCLAQGTIAYHKDLEGWLAGRQATVNNGQQVTLTLEQLDLPQTQNLLLAKIPIDGTGQFYTVEARRKVGYDQKLSGQAVILHKVNPTQQIPAALVDPDGDLFHNDDGAMWLPGETFNDAANGIWVRVDQATATGFVVTISNDCTASAPTPAPTPVPVSTPNPSTLTHHMYAPMVTH